MDESLILKMMFSIESKKKKIRDEAAAEGRYLTPTENTVIETLDSVVFDLLYYIMQIKS